MLASKLAVCDHPCRERGKEDKLATLERWRYLAAAALVLALIASCLPSCGARQSSADGLESARVVYVIDGDTLVVNRGGGEEKVRLIGVNTPESSAEDVSRNCEEGRLASSFVKGLVHEGDTVYLQRDVSETDRYGRLLRYVWLEEPGDARSAEEVAAKMLNGILVASGYAEVKRYDPDTSYAGVFKELARAAETPYPSGLTAHEAAR